MCALVFLGSVPDDAHAQISRGGTPYSFSHSAPSNVPVATMPSVDAAALRAEDRAAQREDRPAPPRFGKALGVRLGLQNAGRWTTLPDGSRLWRLRIASQGAHSINLIFDRFHLPPFAQLFIYNQDRSEVLGAFTNRNNKPHGKFSTTPIPGAVITLEYVEPAAMQGQSSLRVSKVVHGYRDLFGGVSEGGKSGEGQSGLVKQQIGFGASASCNINVNCPEGNFWVAQKRSVAMVVTSSGQRICSGALVNNTSQDLTPYFLTANHCADANFDGTVSSAEIADAETWMFWFNYESTSCSNPSSEPGYDSISGADFKARNPDSDFFLLELSEEPPDGYGVFYAGWDRSGTAPNSTTGIHHPSGDIKKIAIDNDPAVSGTWPGTPAGSHWDAYFDQGTVQGGSSGSPFFDPNHRIAGQLHGGTGGIFVDRCDIRDAKYGKFSMSWDRGSTASTRLKDWLDPNNTAETKIDGKNGVPPVDPVEISGPGTVCQGTLETWTTNRPPSYTFTWAYRDGSSGPWTVLLGGATGTLTYGFPTPMAFPTSVAST